MKLRLVVLLPIIVALLTVFIPAGSASAYYNYAEYTYGMDSQLINIQGVNVAGQGFMTGLMSAPLEYVTLQLYRTGSPGNISLYIVEADDEGKPTGSWLSESAVDGNSITSDGGGQYVRFNLSPKAVLDKNTPYVVVIYAANGSGGNCVNWKVNASSPTYSGGSVVNSSDGGSTWTVDPTKDAYFIITGGPVTNKIESVIVFNDIFETGDQVFVAEYNISYSIPPEEAMTDLFNIELVGHADHKLHRFGYGVSSIYLSADDAVPWSSTQYIRINGSQDLFDGGSAMDTYTVSKYNYYLSGNLKEGQNNLKNYIIQLATNLETRNNMNGRYLFNSSTWGRTLTAEGVTLFVEAIPGIDEIYAGFSSVLSQSGGLYWEYTYNASNYNASYQNSLLGMIGNQTDAAFNGLGSYLAIPGGFLKFLFVVFLYAIIASIVFLVSGNSIAAIILAIPVLGYGAYIGLLPMGVLFTLVFLSFMAMAYYLWLH